MVIENFAPGTADAWGIGHEKISKINPKIIFLSCSTYGQFGPMRYFPGWDLLAQGASGVLTLNGYPDTDNLLQAAGLCRRFCSRQFRRTVGVDGSLPPEENRQGAVY